jgi:hypothetical protein
MRQRLKRDEQDGETIHHYKRQHDALAFNYFVSHHLSGRLSLTHANDRADETEGANDHV